MWRNESLFRLVRRVVTISALVLTLALILSERAWGQKSAEFELSAVRGIGIGETGDRMGRAGWGGSFYGGWFLKETPFTLGFRLALVNYGAEHNRDLFGYAGSDPADMRYSYNFLTTHVVFRIQPRQAFFRPYLEALAGLHYFFTQAYTGRSSAVPFMVGGTVLLIVQDESDTLLSSVVPSAGLGGGLKIRLAKFNAVRKSSGIPWSLFLDLHGHYLVGGTARYLSPGSLSLEGDRLIYEIQHSRISMFSWSLGLSLSKSSRN